MNCFYKYYLQKFNNLTFIKIHLNILLLVNQLYLYKYMTRKPIDENITVILGE